MSNNLTKILSLILSFCLILEQTLFAQSIDLSHYFVHNPAQVIQSDKFRPLHLRYISYDSQANDFKLLLDKGDAVGNGLKPFPTIEDETKELMKYFFIGLALPNEKFWVNLRPDSPDDILDPDLEKTDIGRIFLEADVQLKKDTAGMTSPQTPEGKEYWDKLYKKAGELFGTENITIPTLTRPWIVPDEVIIRESSEGAYIYKATLKVMLEEDYLRETKDEGRGTITNYSFKDSRLKELNEYSTQLIKETIIPKLTREINSARRYAPLRQVYYSLILAQWFKQKYGSSGSARAPGTSASANNYIDLIDSGNLINLTSNQPYDKQDYFKQYQKSFQDGEYNLQEPIHTPMGQSIRRYMSGGMFLGETEKVSSAIEAGKNRAKVNNNFIFAFKNNIPVNVKFYLDSFNSIKVTMVKVIKRFTLTTFSLLLFIPSVSAWTVENTQNKLGANQQIAVATKQDNFSGILEIIRKEVKENGLKITPAEEADLIAVLKSDNPQIDWSSVLPGARIDMTGVLDEITAKLILSRPEIRVIDTQPLEIEGKKVTIYFTRDNNGQRLLGEAMAITFGSNVIIAMDSFDRRLYRIKDAARKGGKLLLLYKKIYPPGTTDEKAMELGMRQTIWHEVFHALKNRDIRNGKFNSKYLDEEFKKYQVADKDKNLVAQEVVGWLGGLSGGEIAEEDLHFLVQYSLLDPSKYPNEKNVIFFSKIIIGRLFPNLGYTGKADIEAYRDFMLTLLNKEIAFNSEAFLKETIGKLPNLDMLKYLPIPMHVFKEDRNSLLLPDQEPPKKSGSSPMQTPSASSAVVDKKIQQCIDKMAELIFDPKTGEFVNNLPLEDMPPGITIEKLTGGRRGSPVYKLSRENKDIVVKFFPLTKESLFGIELEGLKRGEDNLLFQQLITSKEYADMSVGYIVTEFIPGKSFSVDTSSWGFVKYRDKLNSYSDMLKKEFEGIPQEHWEQLVLMYREADRLRITIDANPANLKYDKTKGFTALDYFPTGKVIIGFRHSLDRDIVYQVTGIVEHMFGENNELVDFIKNNIKKAEKTIARKEKVGGIDLSRINKSIRTESVSSPGVGGLNNLVDVDFDLNEELSQLQKLLNAEIVPSADRLNRYSRAACSSSLSSPDSKDSALSLIAETFRLQENKAVPAAPELKALAAWLEQAG